MFSLVDYLGLEKLNVLGWSYGGLVAQTFLFQYPERVAKTILIGTMPPGENEIPIEPVFFEHALKPVNSLDDEAVLFFQPASEKSKRAAKASYDRIAKRLDHTLIPAHQEIFQRYFAGSGTFREDKLNFRDRYRNGEKPVLVISGDHDISFALENWFPLLKQAPSLQLIIVPEAGHGPQHQYPELVAGYMDIFLQN